MYPKNSLVQSGADENLVEHPHPCTKIGERHKIAVLDRMQRERMSKAKRKRAAKSLPHTYEVKAEISNATLAKAKSALTLQIYRKDLKLGELQIGRGSLFWAGARRQSAKRIHWGRFAEMMDRLAYGDP